MIVRKSIIVLLCIGSVLFATLPAHADSSLLTPAENLWLRSRNNSIVVYPVQNNPPYSYQSPSGIIEGLSVDYIELIAQKVGAHVEYLTPRSQSQVLADAATGKGDVVLSLSPTEEREKTFIFTESYITVPAVIVVRKDLDVRKSLTMLDFVGKRVAITESTSIENYVRQNYSRVVIESVTDNEAALQDVVLGEVNASAMDVAALSFLLSKQVLSSVKVAGNVGYDSHPAFAMTKDKEILQSILEKGLTQISTEERQTLTDKWIALPQEQATPGFFVRLQSGGAILMLYVLFALVIVSVCVLLLRRRVPAWRRYQKTTSAEELHNELNELEAANRSLSGELEQVRHLEQDIETKLKHLNE